MFVIEDTARVKIIVQVPESAIMKISEDDSALVSFDTLAWSVEADVHRVLPSADRMSRTFDVELRLDNSEGTLRSGMFARARFAQGEREVLALDESALVTRGQLEGVYVVEGQHARLRWLRLGPRLEDGRVEVLSGLEAGELYVTNPPAALQDGSPVSVR
jgi:RND family efflux transporter MFP subunit